MENIYEKPVSKLSLTEEQVHSVRKCIAEKLVYDITDITDDTDLGDLGADSLDIIDIIIELEQIFSVQIPEEMDLLIVTVLHVLNCVDMCISNK